MENIKEIEVENTFTGELVKYVIIDKGNGEFTSMFKADYDAALEATKQQSGTL